MSFKFSWFCELLENLLKNKHHHATTRARSQNPDQYIIISWFNKYDGRLSRAGPPAIALLSALFPERRVDRVYNLQEKRLAAIFGRALGLGSSRAQELNQWCQRDGDDFSSCVERVMAQCEFDVPLPEYEVTLEEVDEMLHQLAANSPFSSPEVRATRDNRSADGLLTPILRRLQSKEAKWLVRILLKSYIDVCIPERLCLSQVHFMLPYLLSVQNSFEAAVRVLSSTSMATLPPRPTQQYEQALLTLVSKDISPEIGIMIQRQPYYKARSIKHCCNMANKRLISVERKYDGEYCQIHIDLSKGQKCIRIFSKSGKESTQDRVGLHGAIKDCLRIGKADCRIKQRCIIEGELLVWSSYQKQILPFHKIRKYVRHGGRKLGTMADSPVRIDEHLMVALFDVLLHDSEVLLTQPLVTRRRRLKDMVLSIEGRGILGERQVIDFSLQSASKSLRHAFGQAITQRWEGFVLKPCNEPYFSWQTVTHCIKLKKDYITGMGDSADLCLIGGRRDARVEQEIGLGSLRWTSFCVGCLINKDDVCRYDVVPRFKILDELTHHGMSKEELLDFNKFGRFNEAPYDSHSEYFSLEPIRKGVGEPTEIFKQPLVIEITGAGYARPSNCDFYTLRFPRKTDGKVKIHSDRSIKDTVSFRELQDMAHESMNPTSVADDHEEALWVRMLLQADGKSQSTDATSDKTSPGYSPFLAVNPYRSLNACTKNVEKQFSIHADKQHDQRKSPTSEDAANHPSGVSSCVSPCHGRNLKRASNALRDLQQPRLLKRACVVRLSPQPVQDDIGHAPTFLSSSNLTAQRQGRMYDENTTDGALLASFVKESIDIMGQKDSNPSDANQSSIISTQSLPTSPLSVRSCSTKGVAHSVAASDQSQQDSIPKPAPSPISTSLGVTNKHPTTKEYHIYPGICASVVVQTSFSSLSQHSPVAKIVSRSTPSTSSSFVQPCPISHMYVAPSAAQSTSKEAKLRLYNILPWSGTSYTHILESFLDASPHTGTLISQMRTEPHKLVLLDFNNPHDAKADLDDMFNNLVLRAQGGSQHHRIGKISNEQTDELATMSILNTNNIMLWDFSILEYLAERQRSTGTGSKKELGGKSRTKAGIQLTLDISTLASLQHDPVGSELFGGFVRVHQQTWIERRKLRYYLVKHWDWTRTC